MYYFIKLLRQRRRKPDIDVPCQILLNGIGENELNLLSTFMTLSKFTDTYNYSRNVASYTSK